MLRLNPNDALAYYNRGITRRELGNKKGAIEDYNQVLRLNPNDALAYYNRGITRRELGDKKGALADFQQSETLARQQGNKKLSQSARENSKKLQC